MRPNLLPKKRRRSLLLIGLWCTIIGALAALATVGSPAAQASIQAGNVIKFADGPGTPGGIFYVQNVTAPSEPVFDTFCVQLEEKIAFGNTYKVDAISHTSEVAGSRPLTSFAAWLYNSYLNQTLASFDFSIKDAASGANAAAALTQANELQTATWHALGYTRDQIGQGYYDTYNVNYGAWQNLFNADVAANNWSGTGDIYVLNLLGQDANGNYTVNAQDQLARISSVVPEPWSLAVWGGLVAGVLLAKRRGRSQVG
jgi:hypothetical protein